MKQGDTYNPKSYWGQRKNPNNPAGEIASRVDFDCDYLTKMVGDARTIVELGPGTGRTMAAYAPGTRLTTVDITDRYLPDLTAAADRQSVKLTPHILEEAEHRYPFDNNAFPVGVSFQVFIHQPYELFAHSFGELMRVARTVIVCAGIHRNSATSKPPGSPHVFAHDYLAATAAHGRVADGVTLREGRLYFVARPSSLPH
jgi:hypothetical protein